MKHLLLVISTLLFFQASAQDLSWKAKMYDPQINFYEVCKEADAYFKTIDKNVKGSGYKPYQRWRAQNEYKYYPSGDRSTVNPRFASAEFAKFMNETGIERNLFTNGWRDLGPYSLDSLTGHYSAGLGRVEDFYVDPNNHNTVYMGSRSGGFWKSINGGNTWIGRSTDTLPATGVNVIAVSPTNPDSVLINVRNADNGNSHGIYRSVDGGDTWSLSNFNPTTTSQGGLGDNFQIYALHYHPYVANKIFIGTNDGMYVSDDNLQTWTRIMTTYDINQVVFHPTNKDIIYAYNNYYYNNNKNQILVSIDGGATFTLSQVLANNNNSRDMLITTSPLCDSCVWAASSNGMWLSTDEGQTFTYRSNPSESSHGLAVSPVDTNIILHGYVDLTRSLNGGKSFSKVTRWSLGNTNGAGSGHQVSIQTSTDYIHADVRNLRYVDTVVYVATDGFLSKSMDNGTTWENIGNGVGIRENYSLGQSQSNHYRAACGSQDNGSSIRNKKGWVEFYGADGMEAIIHPLNDDWIITSVQYGTRRLTHDGGLSQTSASPGISRGYWVAPLAYDPNHQMNTFDFTDSVMKSTDFGDNYVYHGKANFSGDIRVAAIAENNSNIMVVARNHFIEKSTNGGVSFWTIRKNLPTADISDIAFDPNDDNVIVVTYAKWQNDNQKVFITTDAGNTWTNITYNLGSMPIRSVVIDHTGASNIYLGGEIGVYTMPMNGTAWSLYNTNLPNVTVKELEVCYGSNTLKAATWGRGLWEFNLVDRASYPAILTTRISNQPTAYSPKEWVNQFVTSQIHYNGTLSSVFVKWSPDTAVFNNVIPMTNTVDSTWVSTLPIPNYTEGTDIYFKVYAVGTNGDTTETYKFNYVVRKYEPCQATGNTSSGNLYIENVELRDINNSSQNNLYASYTMLTSLYKDSINTLSVSGNNTWSTNDYGAWIDYNKDLDFDDSEKILFAIGAGDAASANFMIPATVHNYDTVIMRVRLSHWGENPSPCGNTFGEVEDYRIVLRTDTGNTIAIKNLDELPSIKVFPNPTKGEVTIDFGEMRSLTVELSDINGGLIKREEIKDKASHSITLNEAKGVYLLRIISKEGSTFFKVIKQ